MSHTLVTAYSLPNAAASHQLQNTKIDPDFLDPQFLVTGLLGPGANAHGPNEFLHIATGKRLTACVAEVLAAHAKR